MSDAVFGVDEDGNGTVVDQLHLHVCAKDAGGNGFAEGVSEGLDEALVEGDGDFGLGSVDVRGAVAFAGACHEGKLADGKDVAAGFQDGTVHHAFFVIEDTQVGDFGCKPRDVLVGVVRLDAYQDEHAGRNGGMKGAADGDGGALYTLYDCFHCYPFCRSVRQN